MFGFAAVSARGQTADIWNSNTGDQTSAVNGNFSTGPWSGSTPPISTSAVQINSVLAGNGNQTVTLDTTTASTIYSFSLNEDVSGVTNQFVQNATISGTTASTLLSIASTAANAFSITASNGGNATVSLGGTIGNTASQTILNVPNSSIVLNAGAGSTATLSIAYNDASSDLPTSINLGTGSLTIGNGGTGTSQVLLTGDTSTGTFTSRYIITTNSTGNVNINTGGLLKVGSTSNNTTAGLTEAGLISANLVINGGTFEIANAGTGTNTGEIIGLGGTINATGGTIQMDKGNGTGITVLNVNGLTAASVNGTTINAVAAGTTTTSLINFAADANLNNLVFQTNGATSSGSAPATFGASIEFAGTRNQAITSNTGLYNVLVRGGGTVGNTGVSSEGYVKTLTISTNPAAGNIGPLTFGTGGVNGTTNLTTALKLGSNLTAYSGVTAAANFSTIGSAPQNLVLDLSGYTYDATNMALSTGTGGLTLSGANSPTWTVNSLNTGLTASTPGTIRAKAFNFTNTGTGTINIGANVTLLATTSGTTAGFQVINSLAGSTGTAGNAGTIDPTSTFVYTGNDGTLSPTFNTTLNGGSRSTANPLGGITVGDSTSANISVLRLAGNNATTGNNGTVYIGGNILVNASSARTVATNNILNLGGSIVTLVGSASLTGNGTVTGNSGNASVLNWASGATGGLSPGTAGTVGMLTMTVNSVGFTMDMTNAGNSQFDIASTTSFDQIARSSTTNGITLTYGGKLTLNFLNQVAGGTTTYQLFTVGTVAGGTFNNDGSLLANATGNTTGITSITFSEASGLLTVTAAVPEPSTVGLLGGAMLLCCVGRVYLRRRSAA